MSNDECGSTKVRFDLWLVLGFLSTVAFLGFLYLHNTLMEGRAERISSTQTLNVRVATLETQYKYLTDGIYEIKSVLKEIRDDQKRLQMKEVRHGQ